MTDTVKTVLIVGGAAVGVVVLFKMLTPAPATPSKGTGSITDAISLNSLIGLGSSIFNAFGSNEGNLVGTTTSPGAGNSVGYDQGESFKDFYGGMFGPGLDVYEG